MKTPRIVVIRGFYMRFSSYRISANLKGELS